MSMKGFKAIPGLAPASLWKAESSWGLWSTVLTLSTNQYLKDYSYLLKEFQKQGRGLPALLARVELKSELASSKSAWAI